jgi:hypothetical protein
MSLTRLWKYRERRVVSLKMVNHYASSARFGERANISSAFPDQFGSPASSEPEPHFGAPDAMTNISRASASLER